MKKILYVLLIAFSSFGSAATPEDDTAIWATAVSKNQLNGRAIIFRYAKDFRAGFTKSAFPHRVILVWRYESPSGMPTVQERQMMDRMEDAISPLVNKPGFSVLALVSTGENLREWIYYTKSDHEFLQAMNQAHGAQPRFPIEVHAAQDSNWSTYQKFREGVRE